jgi:sec-independent protein translocase protein TatC
MARAALKPVSHEDRLSLVEHLDELRTRLIVCLVGFLVCFGVAFWQNNALLHIMNRPLTLTAFDKTTKAANDFASQQKTLYLQLGALARSMAAEKSVSAATRAQFDRLAATAAATAKATPKASGRKPVTLGVGEPFTATFKVAAYGALLLSLPLMLYQLYAFVLPAFSPREREVAVPLLLMVPFLFIAGVVFGYYVVVPPAIRFLQNFNSDSYDILLQAKDFYGFEVMILAAMGGVFQVPVGILAATRVGIVSPSQLRKGRRYAIVIIAVIAMLLPGQDPVTMLLIMLPLLVLYEGSILIASLVDRRVNRARAREQADAGDDLLLPDDD